MGITAVVVLWAALAGTGAGERFAGAREVFSCNFDASWDQNFDGWPEGWTRRRGPGFPHYLTIAIEGDGDGDDTAARALRIDLDGGSAVAFSPPIPISALCDYVLLGGVRTAGLAHSRAFLSLTFLDEERNFLESHASRRLREAPPGTVLRIGPFSPARQEAAFAVVGLHLEALEGTDLTGQAWFEDLWLGQLPRITLTADRPGHLYKLDEPVAVTCDVSGFMASHREVVLVLEGPLGNRLEAVEFALPPAAAEDGKGEDGASGAGDRLARFEWEPPLTRPGFFRIRAEMIGPSGYRFRESISLAVVEPQAAAPGSEFGWSLPDGEPPLPSAALARLLSEAGIRWLKYPLWFGEDAEPAAVERTLAFTEHLSRIGIELVGMLNRPPPEVLAALGSDGHPAAAEVFTAEAAIWYPSIEPVMMRLATRVRWWQLGSDSDTSFVGFPRLEERLRAVKSQLDRIGQSVQLGVGWDWLAEPAPSGSKDPRRSSSEDAPYRAGATPWRFLSMSTDPPLSATELAEFLPEATVPGTKRWVVIQPLPSDEYDLPTRAVDLAERIMTARIHGAEGVFAYAPFAPQQGLLHADGTPGEMFLPWRTLALALGGSHHFGSIALPAESTNEIFTRGPEAVMIVWNDETSEETLYLGDAVRAFDLWGAPLSVGSRGHEQVIPVGPLPTVVTGVSTAIAGWHTEVAFDRERIPSIAHHPHGNSLRLVNHFDRGVAGTARLVAPAAWRVEPAELPFRLAEGEAQEYPFEITLPLDAHSGWHPVRIDLSVRAEKTYRFSVYRRLSVGMQDVYIETATYLNAEGELEIHQRMTNETDERVSFRCYLFIPGRRRMRSQVLDLPRGHDTQVYALPNGDALVGQTLWLRAEELGGTRVLNYRIEVRGR